MSELVECRGLVYRVGGHRVLSEMELTLGAGESMALLGASGSGKTSLLRIIAGLETPQRGEVRLSAVVATRDGQLMMPPHRRQIAMLFQDLALWPNLTVSENVRLGLFGLRLPRQSILGRVEAALAQCGIGDLAGRLPGTLSGGQQQRVAVARALAVRPRLLLLDEPFSGLDLLTKGLVLEEIARLKADLGFGLILVTHDTREVELLCDSVGVLEEGRVCDRGLLADARFQPRSRLGQAFASDLRGARRARADS